MAGGSPPAARALAATRALRRAGAHRGADPVEQRRRAERGSWQLRVLDVIAMLHIDSLSTVANASKTTKCAACLYASLFIDFRGVSDCGKIMSSGTS